MVLAIDTIVLRSPKICDYVALQLRNNVTKRIALDVETGETLYSFTTAELDGSFDYRVRVRIADTESVYTGNVVEKLSLGTYLEVECSLHKLLLGHNVCGGSDDLYRSVAYLVAFLEYQFKVALPDFHSWELVRIDLAEIFRLPDIKVVQLYIEGLKGITYPRRKVFYYDNECVYWAGSTTTLKIYCKGLEYKKHDFKRIERFFGINNAMLLQDIADKILRVEVEFKKRKLAVMFGDDLRISNINIAVLRDAYYAEINKILGCEKMKTDKVVRLSADVEERLFSTYSARVAKALVGTWYLLCQRGEKHTREVLSKRTFYRHIKLLRDCGVAWNGSEFQCDYTTIGSVIPIDFQISRDSKYRLDFVAPAIQDKLGKIKLLA